MKNQPPAVKGFLFVFAILAAVFILNLLTSCEKSDVYPVVDEHSLIFEKGNYSTFYYASHHPDSASNGWTEIPNGYELKNGDSYSFFMVWDKVFVTLNREPVHVKHCPSGLSACDFLTVNEKLLIQKLLPNSSFIIRYPWRD